MQDENLPAKFSTIGQIATFQPHLIDRKKSGNILSFCEKIIFADDAKKGRKKKSRLSPRRKHQASTALGKCMKHMKCWISTLGRR